LSLFRRTGERSYGADMATYDVTLRDHTVESVDADAYQQEGPMTTFFRLGDGRDVVDCWARRVASVRTADILLVRLSEDVAALRAVV
jgi:hypothetical protein